MCAKWALDTNKFQEIINKLESARRKSKDNKVSFVALTFDEDISTLLSFVAFSTDIPECERLEILKDSIFALGEQGEIESMALIAEISKTENEFLRKPLEDYRLITNLSVKYLEKFHEIDILGNQVHFYASLPKEYDRSLISANAKHSLIADEPDDYTWLSVLIKARTVADAANKGLDLVDLLRGIWNLFLNHQKLSRTTLGGKINPVNDILKGPLHTVHWPDGRLVTDSLWWYDPSYVAPHKLFDLNEKWDELIKYQQDTLNLIQQSQSPFREIIEDSIRRYTRALDEADLHNAFLRLWSLIENLTGTQNASYGETIKRASFFYEDRDFAKQILNHLRTA